jgi:hypothetical protein
VGGDVPVDSETLLVTDFVNLKIKPAQSFEGAHSGRICVHVFIEVSAYTCMSIYVCTMFLKKEMHLCCYMEELLHGVGSEGIRFCGSSIGLRGSAPVMG